MNTPRYQEMSDFSLRSLSDPALTVAMLPGQSSHLGLSGHKQHGTLLTELGQPTDFAHAFHGTRESYGAEVALPLIACVFAAALLGWLDIYQDRHPRLPKHSR